jgi:hypothetical protein
MQAACEAVRRDLHELAHVLAKDSRTTAGEPPTRD